MSQSFDDRIVSAFLQKRGESLVSIKREEKAYSNLVYQIISDKKKYLYKQYINQQRNNEIEILKHVSTPKIYEMGKNYRIEEFLKHQVPDFQNDLKLIANTLAQFHLITVPKVCKFEDILHNLIKENLAIKYSSSIIKLYNKIKQKLQIRTMNGLLHMDLQIGNMLKIGNAVQLIDFEYSCLGDITIDITNFFCETMADYQNDSILKAERGFDAKSKMAFLKEYVRCNKQIGITAEELYNRVDEMQCISHFFWYLWGRKHVFMNKSVSDCFDYTSYSLNRLAFLSFRDFKEDFLLLDKELRCELCLF